MLLDFGKVWHVRRNCAGPHPKHCAVSPITKPIVWVALVLEPFPDAEPDLAFLSAEVGVVIRDVLARMFTLKHVQKLTTSNIRVPRLNRPVDVNEHKRAGQRANFVQISGRCNELHGIQSRRTLRLSCWGRQRDNEPRIAEMRPRSETRNKRIAVG